MKNIKFYEHQKNVFLPGEPHSRTTQHSPQDERGPLRVTITWLLPGWGTPLLPSGELGTQTPIRKEGHAQV